VHHNTIEPSIQTYRLPVKRHGTRYSNNIIKYKQLADGYVINWIQQIRFDFTTYLSM